MLLSEYEGRIGINENIQYKLGKIINNQRKQKDYLSKEDLEQLDNFDIQKFMGASGLHMLKQERLTQLIKDKQLLLSFFSKANAQRKILREENQVLLEVISELNGEMKKEGISGKLMIGGFKCRLQLMHKELFEYHLKKERKKNKQLMRVIISLHSQLGNMRAEYGNDLHRGEYREMNIMWEETERLAQPSPCRRPELSEWELGWCTENERYNEGKNNMTSMSNINNSNNKSNNIRCRMLSETTNADSKYEVEVGEMEGRQEDMSWRSEKNRNLTMNKEQIPDLLSLSDPNIISKIATSDIILSNGLKGSIKDRINKKLEMLCKGKRRENGDSGNIEVGISPKGYISPMSYHSSSPVDPYEGKKEESNSPNCVGGKYTKGASNFPSNSPGRRIERKSGPGPRSFPRRKLSPYFEDFNPYSSKEKNIKELECVGDKSERKIQRTATFGRSQDEDEEEGDRDRDRDRDRDNKNNNNKNNNKKKNNNNRMRYMEGVKNVRRSTQFSMKPLFPSSPKMVISPCPKSREEYLRGRVDTIGDIGDIGDNIRGNMSMTMGSMTMTLDRRVLGERDIKGWNSSTKVHKLDKVDKIDKVDKVKVEKAPDTSTSIHNTTTFNSPKVNVIKDHHDKYLHIINTLKTKTNTIKPPPILTHDEESDLENNLGVESPHIPQITNGKLLLIQQNTPQFGHKKLLNKNYFY